ncbi:hypothetical protein GCM10023093_29800 [Nemorincola caseinilytica]|uniref:DUF3822 family protein n=1 Tax=Nemorincola caseinilytica TaxID=2054315 RepID=A0ABP8NRT5_9BACT
MAAANTNKNEQVYNIREDEQLLSRVALVVCVLTRRELYIAGLSITKELLTIHYYAYNANKPVWETGFFEQLFANEPLLLVREKVKGIFIASDRELIVPDELYNEAEAIRWLHRLHFIEQNDVIRSHPLENDKATYMLAVPLNIAELIKINFKKAAVLPLPAYHFGERPAQSLHLQLCFGNGQVAVTLHNYSQLLWHRYIEYTSAEDVAFAIRAHCRENYIDPAKLTITCNALSAAEYDVINELSAYFQVVKAGNGLTIHARWDPAITLANQLLECVS